MLDKLCICLLILVAQTAPYSTGQPPFIWDERSPTAADWEPVTSMWSNSAQNGIQCTACIAAGSNFCATSGSGMCVATCSSCPVCVTTSDECFASLPTNQWWGTLSLNQSLTPNGALPAVTHPYYVKAPLQGLYASYSEPAVVLESSGMESVITTYEESIALTLFDSSAIERRVISKYDEATVTLNWLDYEGQSVLSSTLARGDPFLSLEYRRPITVAVHSIHAVVSINGETDDTKIVSGSSFEIVLNDGANGNQLWLLTASPSIEFSWSSGVDGKLPFSQNRRMISTTKWAGVLRLAAVPLTTSVSTLLSAAACRITSSDVTYSGGADDMTIEIRFVATDGGQSCTPLIGVLPHHLAAWGPSTSAWLPLTYRTIRGPLRTLRSSSVTLHTSLAPLTDANVFTGPRGIPSDRIAEVEAALTVEAEAVVPSVNPNTYFRGKEIARVARLLAIALQLAVQGRPVSASVTTLTTVLRQALTPVLAADGPIFRYDPLWGGICSKIGLTNPSQDFGQGWYNDHHFHYGYYLYSAAVLGLRDPAWLATYRDAIVTLARDIANPSVEDGYFPLFRHFDWWEGHSYATGLFSDGDGKNQESSSEAINAWGALWMLGVQLNNTDMISAARALLSLEIVSTQTYWHVAPWIDVYPSTFRLTHGIAGIVWSSKVDHTTFFGAEEDFIQGIQMLPFTPFTELYLDSCWVQSDLPYILSAINDRGSLGPISQEWHGFLIMAKSIVDSASAWFSASLLTLFDDGNSKTNTLWWIATRPPPKTSCPVVTQPTSDVKLEVFCAVAGGIFLAAAVEIRRCFMRRRWKPNRHVFLEQLSRENS